MVKRVFHFSDFHIDIDCGEPKSNKLFMRMISSIKTNFRIQADDCNYLVYTGDIIDSCKKKDEKDDEYKKRIEDSFLLAGKYFTTLMITLGVVPERLIICPGNHDKIRSVTEADCALCESMPDYADYSVARDYSIFSAAYQLYSNFVKDLGGVTSNFIPTYYSIDDLNFLIINSTWKEKEAEGKGLDSKLKKTYNRCIDCSGVLGEFEKNKDALGRDKRKNIIISHDPLWNWCENSIIPYEKGIKEYVRGKIESYFSYMLCGDIHQNTDLDYIYCVKTKIYNSKQVDYGCIEYKGDNPVYRSISVSESGPDKPIYDKDVLEDVIKVSSLDGNNFYVKELAFRFLYGKETKISLTSISKAGKDFYKMFVQSDSRWSDLNAFFEMFTNFREFGDKERKIKVDKDIFAVITSIIKDDGDSIRLAVKSRPSQGKSTFLSLLYLFLLGMFIDGDLSYIPVYFNRDKLIELPYKDKISVFIQLYEKANQIADKLDIPVCFILDGFNQYNYFANSFDDYVFENYLEYEDNESERRNAYILAIDTDKFKNTLETHVASTKKSARVLYFQDIETKGLRTHTADNFLNQLTQLLNLKNGEKIVDGIRNSGMEYVDMNLVVRHGDAFANGEAPDVVFDSYGRKENVFEEEDKDKIPKCAYQILFLNTKYNMLDADIKVSHKSYCTLCQQREVGMYYCSKYYFEEIKRLSSNKKEKVELESVLNNFFTHEQNYYLKNLRDKHVVTLQEVERFINNHYNELTPLGKAQLIYLYGRQSCSHGENLFEKAGFGLETLCKMTDVKGKDERFKAEILNRTIRVISSFDDPDKMSKYIMDLLANPIERRVNRATHMYYYYDVEYDDAKKIYYNNIVYKGFDIYHTFLVLSNRLLNPSYDYSKNIRLLDLVTLCDLMEHRFRQPEAKTIDNKECNSYFYNDLYYGSADISPQRILKQYIMIIDNYEFDDIDNDIIKIYVEKCRQDAQKVLDYLAENPCLEKNMFHRSKVYEKIKQIETEERKGWKIPRVMEEGTPKDSYQEFEKGESLETVEQHVYQTYLIGLLYLPEDYPDRDELREYKNVYDKQKVLNTILIHDIGESETGDWPSFIKERIIVEENENRFNKNVFIGGAYSETSNLIDYLLLWENWETSKRVRGTGDINAIIARELDKIQFLHKFNELMRAGKLKEFDEERIKQINETRKEINTSVGKKILNIVVDSNPLFE